MQTHTSENECTDKSSPAGTTFFISKNIINQSHSCLNPINSDLNVLFNILENYKRDHLPISFKTQNLQLISEEAFVNIVNYGNSKKNIEFLIGHNAKEILIQFVDSGTPFNPCEHGSNPINTSLEDEIQIGGLGIIMMKKMSKEVFYQRSGDKNFLCIVFDL